MAEALPAVDTPVRLGRKADDPDDPVASGHRLDANRLSEVIHRIEYLMCPHDTHDDSTETRRCARIATTSPLEEKGRIASRYNFAHHQPASAGGPRWDQAKVAKFILEAPREAGDGSRPATPTGTDSAARGDDHPDLPV